MGIRHSIIVRTLTHAFHFCSWSETIEREHEAKYVEVRLLAISCHTLAIRRIIQVLALVDWYGRASWRNLDPLRSSLPEAPFPIEPYYQSIHHTHLKTHIHPPSTHHLISTQPSLSPSPPQQKTPPSSSPPESPSPVSSICSHPSSPFHSPFPSSPAHSHFPCFPHHQVHLIHQIRLTHPH